MRGDMGGDLGKAFQRSFIRLSVVLAVAVAGGTGAGAPTAPFIAKAEQAYMIDAETGTVLLTQNESQNFPPASLAKLMTVEVMLDALKKGEVTAETQYPLSQY